MKKLLLLVFFACVTTITLATHLRCGYIQVQRTSCTTREVFITIVVITNSASNVPAGQDGYLYFGDGTQFLVPAMSSNERPDLGPDISIASYTVRHSYAGVGSFVIGYLEPNRNAGILNMENSVFTPFYTETIIDLATLGVCWSMDFIAPPVFSGFTNSQLSFSLGASSSTDGLITYEKTIPYRDRALPVYNYMEPDNMLLNTLTGLLTWNAEMAQQGEYNFAINAVQWFKVEGELRRIGHMRIDFQVILAADPTETSLLSDNQSLDEYSRVRVAPGEEKDIRLFYEIDNSLNPEVEIFSSLHPDATEFHSYDSTSTSNGKFIKVGLLKIKPRVQDDRKNGYVITVRGRHYDNPDFQASSDINYLVYTDEFQPLPEIITSTDNELTQVQAFPNPFIERIKIKINRPGVSEALIYNMQGIPVKRVTFDTETELFFSGLPPGVYICDIRKNNQSLRKLKLLKTQ